MTPGFVHRAFEETAARRPDAAAVREAGGAVAYGELNARANGVAAGLRRDGVAPSDVVALAMAPGAGYAAALLGVFKAGCTALPLDPAAPPRRLESMLRTAQPVLLLTDPAGGPPGLPAPNAGERPPARLPGEWEPCSANPPPAGDPDDVAYLMFTSGSTGTPKAVAGRHAGLHHFLAWEIGEFGLGERDRVSLLAPPTFDVSLRDLFAPLLSGGTLCVPPPDARADPARLARWLEDEAITHMHCVPSLFRALLQALGDRPSPPLPRMQRILLAGEPLYAADVEQWRRRAGERIELVNLYGPTETTLAKAFYRIGALPPTASGTVPIGRAIPGAELLILRGARASRPGEIGEIVIRTAYRSAGYYRDEALTAEKFVPNPLTGDPADIVYRTGDQGRLLADGAAEFVGRLDAQVKINGVRVELGEVEAALRACPRVLAAAAAAHTDEQGRTLLAAYYVADGELDAATVQRHLSDYLPAAMLPSVVIRLPALPLNLHGKVDRGALPKPEAAAIPSVEFAPPCGATEEKLAVILAEALRLARVPADRPFLELGGDSLRAVQVIRRVYLEFGVELTLRVILQEGTVRNLARWIERQPASP